MLRLGGVCRVVFYILPISGKASQREIWIWERLKISKVRERCKEMGCAESLQRTVSIRELIWKEIRCEIAARLSTLASRPPKHSRASEAASAQPGEPRLESSWGCSETTNC